MGALVNPSCGHASHLFNIDVERSSPQIHVHHLTDPSEFDLTGFMKIEFCCHGCSSSLLVYYQEPREHEEYSDTHSKSRDAFFAKHKRCPNRGYERYCPNDRLTISFLDLRSVPHTPVQKKAPAEVVSVPKLTRRLPGRLRHH